MGIFDFGSSIPAIDVEEARRRIEERRGEVIVLDVRNPEEWYGETGHIEGARLIPLDALPLNLDRLKGQEDKEILCFCYVGDRSKAAARLLKEEGFRRVWNVEGGMMEWCDAGYPTVNANTWPGGTT